MHRTFYDLGKVGYWGPQSKGKVDFGFDRSRTIAPAQVEDWDAAQDRSRKARERKAAVAAQRRAEAAAGFEAPEAPTCGQG